MRSPTVTCQSPRIGVLAMWGGGRAGVAWRSMLVRMARLLDASQGVTLPLSGEI